MKRIIYGSLSVLTAIGTTFTAAKADVINTESNTFIAQERSADEQPLEAIDSDVVDPVPAANDLPAGQSAPVQLAPEVDAGAAGEIELTPIAPTPAQPGLTAPGLTAPGLTEPGLTEPEMTDSEMTDSEMTEPEMTESEMTGPDLVEPEMTGPDLVEPDAIAPGASDSDFAEPGMADPSVGDPNLDALEAETLDEPATNEALPPIPQESPLGGPQETIVPITPNSPVPQAPGFPSAPVEPVPDFPSAPVEPTPLPPLEENAPLEDSAVPGDDFSVGASSRDRLIGEGFSPFQLSYLAIAGGLKEEGIPGGSILLSAYSQGDISAADIVDAGALSNRLGTAADDQTDYTNGVDRFLGLLERDARND